MMTRSAHTNDRLKSSFYWPDDSNREANPRRLNFNASQLQSPVSPSNSDIYSEFEEASLVSRDRKKKLLTSNIEFYDMVDTSNDSHRKGAADNVAKHKKLQQQTSKIEFYDYVDAKSPTTNGHKKASVVEADTNGPAADVQAKNDVNSKKITETRNNGVDECDESKLEQINGSVKKMNLKSPENDDECDDEEVYLKRQQQNNHTKDSNDRQATRPRRLPLEYSDEDNEYGGYYRYEDERDYYPPNRRRYSRRPPEIYDEEEDEIYYACRQRPPRYPDEYRRPAPRRASAYYEDEYPRVVQKPPIGRQHSTPRRPSPNDEPYYEDTPVTRQRHMDEANNEFDRLSAIRMNRASTSPKQADSTYIEDCEYYRKPSARLSRSVSICSSIGSTNESKARAHRHLKSNIFHNNDDVYYDDSNSRRPRSIRDSAAEHRSTIGLPDIN
jgi:hypothetical protein